MSREKENRMGTAPVNKLMLSMGIPMIISMAVAFFDIHDGMMPDGELSLIYFIVVV